METLIEKLKNNTITADERNELQAALKKDYYEKGKTPLTDEEYDFFFDTNTEEIGYRLDDSHYQVFNHSYPMGSLNKVKTFETAQAWLEKLNKPFVVQPKLDGLSMGLYFNNGQLTHALLRGSGVAGENIIENALKFDGVPQQIEDKGIRFVRGEIVIAKSKFEQITDSEYSNRRNAVSGIARRYDGKYAELLSFYVYGLEADTFIPTQSARMERAHNAGFKVPFTLMYLREEDYLKFASIRTSAEEFQMDGLVLKQNEIDPNDNYSGRPSTQIALKFPPEGNTTIVTGYDWELGTTGKLTPVIRFETTNVQGTNISKASFGSAKAVKEFGAGIGAKVLVQRMGDVIPKVTKLVEKGDEPIIPTVCPECGEPLVWEGANLFCKNSNCTQKLIAACGRTFWAMGIKGVSTDFIHELVRAGMLQRFSQVVTMTAALISNHTKITPGRAEKIEQKIKEFLKNSTYKDFLWMLNIAGVSGKAIDKMAEAFPTVELLLNATKEECTNCLGNSKGTSLYEYIQDNKKTMDELNNGILYVKGLQE